MVPILKMPSPPEFDIVMVPAAVLVMMAEPVLKMPLPLPAPEF